VAPKKKKPETKTGDEGTEIIVSKLRVAKDGTRRGLQRRRAIKETLIDKIQKAVETDTGIVNWDPVVMMAVIAGRAFAGYPAVDDDGNPILDPETGKQVMVPPNHELAAAVSAKVAPYLHPHIRPKEVGEDDEKNTDPDEKKDQVLAALENMGVKVKRDD